MKIKAILTQHRRDFTAVLECSCGATQQLNSGYDDDNYHRNVIPNMVCPSCNKTEFDYTDTPQVMQPKYPPHFVI